MQSWDFCKPFTYTNSLLYYFHYNAYDCSLKEISMWGHIQDEGTYMDIGLNEFLKLWTVTAHKKNLILQAKPKSVQYVPS